MKTYAGIGSRTIASEEFSTIKRIAKKLSQEGLVLHSGNANGADNAFQLGSSGRCIIYLPWPGFNSQTYDPRVSIASYVIPSETYEEEARRFHYIYDRLSHSVQCLMRRNVAIILGNEHTPPVKFVVYCADEENGNVKGGTGFTVKVAKSVGVPAVNIRTPNWKIQLRNIVDLVNS